MVSCLCCANFCSVFALTGIIFLIIIGVLLEKQPLYIKGTHDPAHSAQACYQGAAIYFAVWALSIITLILDYMRKKNPLRAKDPNAEEPMIHKTYGAKTYGALATNDK